MNAHTQLSQGYPLKRLFLSLMVDHDLIDVLRLDVPCLVRLLTRVEDGYRRTVPCTAKSNKGTRAGPC